MVRFMRNRYYESEIDGHQIKKENKAANWEIFKTISVNRNIENKILNFLCWQLY